MMDHIQIIAQVHTITHLKKVVMMNVHQIQMFIAVIILRLVVNTQHLIVHNKANIYMKKIYNYHTVLMNVH